MKNLSEIFLNDDDPTSLTKDQNAVHGHIYKFYNNLFSHKETINNFGQLKNFIHDCDLPQVKEAENQILKAPVTTDEIANFITHMNNNKSPEFTGITPAFYRVFWHKLKKFITEAIQD